MDFGRVADISSVDFALPGDAPGTDALLAGLDVIPKDARRLRIGSPRWADPGFTGRLYPRGTAADDRLGRYARAFDAIELNTTWYAYDADQIARWAEQTPETFRFCPKIHKEISHERQLVRANEPTQAFCAAIRGFGENLGPAWLLPPPEFGPDRLDDLSTWLQCWPEDLALAIELRHPGWFEGDWGAEVFDLLERRRVTAVLTDVAGRRDVLHMRLTAPSAFVRFVGNRLDPSDHLRLEAWADRLGSWFDRGLSTAHVFLHQPEEHLVLDIAGPFLKRANARCGTNVTPPPVLDDEVQGTLF